MLTPVAPMLAQVLGAGHWCALFLAASVTVCAQTVEGRELKFDIPAQALGDALFIYSSVTGTEVLVPGDIVVQRRSSDVIGVFSAEYALRTLLVGTGLTPRYTGSNAFTLLQDVKADAFRMKPRISRFDRYSAAIQRAVANALCRHQDTRPGSYRVAARLWVGPSGTVKQVSFLGTSGSEGRDLALADLLGRLVIGEAPPDNLPQPTTVLILPRREQDCATNGAGVAP